jgi:hypothetical protein
MTEQTEIAWKRIAIEAPVIVISILLAFAIDAGWEERDERQAETILLERLQADYAEIQSTLALVLADHREASEACVYLMKMAAGEALPATDEVDRMVAVVFLASRTFNPGSGAVASFRSADGARLIQNKLLADKLLAWPGLVEELQEEEANLQKGVAERWSPYLASRVNVGPYLATYGELMQGIPDAVSTPANREPLVVDDVFIRHVLDRYKWQQIALRDVEPVISIVDDILAIIETELGD